MITSLGPGDEGESTLSIRGSSPARARSDGCHGAEAAHQAASASRSERPEEGSCPSSPISETNVQPPPGGAGALVTAGSDSGSAGSRGGSLIPLYSQRRF